MLWWITIKSVASKVGIWLKNYWYIPLFAIASICFWKYIRNQKEKFATILSAATVNYKGQLKALQEKEAESKRNKQEIEEKYQKIIADLQKERDSALQELSKKEKADIKKYTEMYSDDQEALKKILEEKFGLKERIR